MTPAGESRDSLRASLSSLALLKRICASPRLYVYTASTLLVVTTSYFLGKEMLWDTLYYHVYAGFSALHNRFGRDYFAAGPQGYFNPYAYVPFYLLIRSSLTPLAIASILAVMQSAILWLTYELATASVPRDKPQIRVLIGVSAVIFAFANPILINEFGSSAIDVTTAEIVLAGWLALIAALRNPGLTKVVFGGLLLGAASALKPTNAVHAVAAAAIPLFVPGSFRRKLGYTSLFVAGVGVAFVVVNLPWSLHLERHFGNPVFPLLNGVFRSPEYPTGSMLDYRYIPGSLRAALLRPFAMVLPIPLVDYGLAAPDLRYALLVAVVVTLFLRWGWRRMRAATDAAAPALESHESRVLAALGCAFLLDWMMWLTVSGNGRYFIPMACVAGALGVVLLFRLCAQRPALLGYLLAALFGVQLFQLYAGSGYRTFLPWRHGPWYSVTVPAVLARQPKLYIMVGGQTNSFIIPDMPDGSAFVNLGGGYLFITPDSPNGRRVEALIQRYAPHVRVVMRDPRSDASVETRLLRPSAVNDVLAPFGLRAQDRDCANIVVRGVHVSYTVPGATRRRASATHTEYLMTCRVVRASHGPSWVFPGQRQADLAFDHLEEACPALFRPRQPGDQLRGDRRDGYYFARYYPGTGVEAWITHGSVEFEKLFGGHEESAGTERMWQSGVPSVACGRAGAGFVRVVGSHKDMHRFAQSRNPPETGSGKRAQVDRRVNQL